VKPAGARPAAVRRTARKTAPVPAAPRFALARRVTADLARLQANLAAAARRVRGETDREAAHDLRVASRRLASALDVWGAMLGVDRTRRLQRSLRRLRRSAGPLRDAEVTHELLARLAGNLPHYSKLAVEDLARRIERRMLRRTAPAARAARGVLLRKIARELDRSLRTLARPIGAAASRASAIERVDQLERAARGALASAIRDRRDDALHAARIAVKRWRYGLESLRALDPDGSPAAKRRAPGLAETRSLQRGLGHLHDLAGLRMMIERRIQRLLERERRAEAEALQQALPLITREREGPLAEIQGLVTTRKAVTRRRAG
jgi:CHAD domain-containing protein